MKKKLSFVNIVFFVVFGVLTGVLWAYLSPDSRRSSLPYIRIHSGCHRLSVWTGNRLFLRLHRNRRMGSAFR